MTALGVGVGWFIIGVLAALFLVPRPRKKPDSAKTYEVVWEHGMLTIKCLVCGAKSYHKTDVNLSYCDNCAAYRHTFGGV